MKHHLEKISSCQICKGTSFKDFLRVIDHNVSGDSFNISECSRCGFRFTNPRPKEETIGRYYKSNNYISHSSSKKGLINKIYHIVRNYQFKKKTDLITSRIETYEKKVLDIGCGTGDFINYLTEKGWVAAGIETDSGARKIAAEKNHQRVFENIEKLNGEKFDVITMWHVLEHVYDLNTFLKSIYTLLNDKGLLVVGVPNNASYDAEFYKENWYAYDPPIHLSHFRIKNISELAKTHNFKIKNIDPLIFDAYYISMLSAKKSKKWVISGLFRGWLSNILAKKNGNYSSLAYFLFK